MRGDGGSKTGDCATLAQPSAGASSSEAWVPPPPPPLTSRRSDALGSSSRSETTRDLSGRPRLGGRSQSGLEGVSESVRPGGVSLQYRLNFRRYSLNDAGDVDADQNVDADADTGAELSPEEKWASGPPADRFAFGSRDRIASGPASIQSFRRPRESPQRPLHTQSDPIRSSRMRIASVPTETEAMRNTRIFIPSESSFESTLNSPPPPPSGPRLDWASGVSVSERRKTFSDSKKSRSLSLQEEFNCNQSFSETSFAKRLAKDKEHVISASARSLASGPATLQAPASGSKLARGMMNSTPKATSVPSSWKGIRSEPRALSKRSLLSSKATVTPDNEDNSLPCSRLRYDEEEKVYPFFSRGKTELPSIQECLILVLSVFRGLLAGALGSHGIFFIWLNISSVLHSPQSDADRGVPMCSELANSVCSSARLVPNVVFLGQNTSSVDDIQDITSCCRLCAEDPLCVTLSYLYLESQCILVHGVAQAAIVKAWSKSLVLERGGLSVGGTLMELAKHAHLAREASWWDALQTFKFSRPGNSPRFQISASYVDHKGGRKTRWDYEQIVRNVLKDYGMREIKQQRGANALPSLSRETNQWDLFWGLQWKSIEEFAKADLEPWQLLNMLPGAARLVLGEKDVFHRLVSSAHVAFPRTKSFLLQSFLLPGEMEAFAAQVDQREASSAWVYKELNAWSGDGVRVMPSTATTVARLRGSEDKVVLQSYVLRPLTLNGHKFDTRWWLLITSLSPLRVHLAPDAYVRTASTEHYNAGPEHFDNKCMHITNGKVQRECKSRPQANVRESAFSINDPNFVRDLRDSYGMNLGEQALDKLVARTRSVMVQTTLLALPELKRLRTVTKARCFQLLSFDIVYSAEPDPQPWVIEVNTNGFLGGGILKVAGDTPSLVADLFGVVGAKGYDRSPYQDRLERGVAAVAKNRGFSEDKHREFARNVQEAADEIYHRGLWQPLYPFPLREEDTEVDALGNHFDTAKDTDVSEVLTILFPWFRRAL